MLGEKDTSRLYERVIYMYATGQLFCVGEIYGKPHKNAYGCIELRLVVVKMNV